MSQKLNAKTHSEAVASYFSGETEYWKSVYQKDQNEAPEFRKAHFNRRKEIVLQGLDQFARQNSNALDVGCGSGDLLEAMAVRGHRISGTDISERMVEEATERLKPFAADRAVVQLGAIEQLPFKNATFDVVTCIGVIEYLLDEKKGLSEISRIVKDGGVVIVTLPNLIKFQNVLDPYYWFIQGFRYIFAKTFSNSRKKTEIQNLKELSTNDNFRNRRYLRGSLRKLFSEVGLQEVSQVGLGYGPLTFWRRDILPDSTSIKISQALESVSQRKLFRFLDLFANRWVICLKKMESI